MVASIQSSLASLARWFDGQRDPVLNFGNDVSHRLDFGDPAAPAADHADVAVEVPRPLGKSRQHVARIFDAAHPVRTRAELVGRDEELGQLLAAVFDFRQHVVIHGARGSGKTSLVRILGDHADQAGAVVLYTACDPGASFADLMRPYIETLPLSAVEVRERDGFRRAVAALPLQFGPRAFVETMAERIAVPTVFVLDEFDRVEDPLVKADVSATMKLLSDAFSQILFVIVGIARTVSDVVEAHPSLRRHMRIMPIGRIATDDVDALIARGEQAVGLQFDADARALVVRAACGSPYHVRMFCHLAARVAIDRDDRIVGATDMRFGFVNAFEQWAMMNEVDATLLVGIVASAGRPERAALEDLARRAATDDVVDTCGYGAVGRLIEGALQPEPGDPALMRFRDSVAPQFLIALILTDNAAGERHIRHRRGI